MRRLPVQEALRRPIAWLNKPGVLERLLVIAILVGVALRFATLWTLPPRYDATAYMAEGDSLARGMGFVAPWGRYDDPYSSTPQPTNLGPVYPMYLAAFYRAFGFSVAVTQAAALVLALVTLGVAYLAARDLYGKRTGLLTCALLAANPWLVIFPGMEWSENMVLLFFILTVWALLRGLRTGRTLPFALAGLGAAGFALTKAQGLSFVLIGGAALGLVAWRVYERGVRSLRDPATWALVATFLAPLLAWAAWGPQPGLAPTLSHPTSAEIAAAALVKLAFVVFTIAFTFAFLFPELLQARGAWRTAEGRLLWLAGLGLAAMIWVLLTTAFAAGETPGEPLWKPEQARHLIPVTVPLLWLAVSAPAKSPALRIVARFSTRRVRWTICVALLAAIPVATWLGTFLDGLFLLALAAAVHVRPTNARMALLLVLALLVATNGAFDVRQAPHVQAGEWLQVHAHPGDILGVDPWSPYQNGTVVPGPTYKYELYPYLADTGIRVVPYASDANATYVLSYRSDTYPGYRLVKPLYWESSPGPLYRGWESLVNLGRSLLGHPSPNTPAQPEAWLLERVP